MKKRDVKLLIKTCGFGSYKDGCFWVTCCDEKLKIDGDYDGEYCFWAYCSICETHFDWEPPLLLDKTNVLKENN